MDAQQEQHLNNTTRTSQIIIFALVMGPIFFAGVVLFLQQQNPDAAKEAGINSTMAAGATLLSLVAAVVVPQILRRTMRQSIATGKPLGQNTPAPISAELGDFGLVTAVFQTTLIVGAAILESTVFYNLVAYMLEDQIVNLVCAALLITAMFFKFPTRTRIENWVNDELKAIEELRSLDG